MTAPDGSEDAVDLAPCRLAPHIPALPAHRAQIDAPRALAMAGVLQVHFWTDAPVTGFVRVSLFFVGPGFPITHVLYRARVRNGEPSRNGQPAVPTFHIRRALRLRPALAVLVAVGSFFDIDGFRERARWHILPLSNFSFAHFGDVRPFVTGQLWSLSLLEQFYLFWPLVLLFLPLPLVYVLAGAGRVLVVFLLILALPYVLREGIGRSERYRLLRSRRWR